MNHLKDYDTNKRFSATLTNVKLLTPPNVKGEVKNLTLKPSSVTVSINAGQSVGILLASGEATSNSPHFRIYSVAGVNEITREIDLCVKRCSYIDEFNGEEYQGLTSNYLCDLEIGSTIDLTGPYRSPFSIPNNENANLIMIGMGTGIAPFRVLIKEIYSQKRGWKGQVRLFYGARTGLELLYLNDEQNDFENYYDQETFKAFTAISSKPYIEEIGDIDKIIEERANELLTLLQAETYVYVAGLQAVEKKLNDAFSKVCGSSSEWLTLKKKLIEDGKWGEVLY